MRIATIVLVSTLCLPALAFGLGDDVLIYYGNSGNNIGFTQLVSYLNGIAPSVVLTSVWPASFANYRLCFTALAGHTNGSDFFSPAQVADLAAFIAGGGRLVVIGDYSPFTNNEVSNQLMADLGVTMIFTGVMTGPSCNTNFATDITPDPITEGVTSLEYAAATRMNYGGGTAQSLVRATDGSDIICVGQPAGIPPRPCFDVVGQGDVNILSDACDGMQNVSTQNYVSNLYTCTASTPVEPSTWGAIKAVYEN